MAAWIGVLKKFDLYQWPVLLFAALACAPQTALAQEPTLADLFSGKARFQTPAESDRVRVFFKDKTRNVLGQKFAFFEREDEPGMIYAATRGEVQPGLYNIFLLKSKDGICFTQVSTATDPLGDECRDTPRGKDDPVPVAEDRAVFDSYPRVPEANKEYWTLYDPYITLDTTSGGKRYVMTMECAQFHQVPYWYSTFSASLCTSTSRTPWDPASWTPPKLVVEIVGTRKSASTGVILINDQNRAFLKWTVVDDGSQAESPRGSYSNQNVSSYTGTTYLPRISGRAGSASEADAQNDRVTRPADISTVRATLGTAPPPGTSVTITGRLRKSAGDPTNNTQIRCTIDGKPQAANGTYQGEGQFAANECIDYFPQTKHYFTAPAQGFYDWMVTVSGAPIQTTIALSWEISYPDEGTESASTWAMEITGKDATGGLDFARYRGYSTTAGKRILGAEQNTHCNSSWDCNNADVQDWQQIDGVYYAIYNGANYYRCSRPPSEAGTFTNQWGLAIRRSNNPMGPYDESTGPILLAPTDNICGISYPILKKLDGKLYLYYDYYPAANRSEARRSMLVWAETYVGASYAPTPASPTFDATFLAGELVVRPRTQIRLQDSFLSMQADGNLVMYQGTPEQYSGYTFNAGTDKKCSSNNCAAVLQADGNFVMYDLKDGSTPVPIWDSLNNGKPKAERIRLSSTVEFLPTRDFPKNGFVLHAGESIRMTTGYLIMQTDGNLVVYPTPSGTALWGLGTDKQCFSGFCEAVFQADGNLVLYDDGYPYWSSGTRSSGANLRVSPAAPFLWIEDATGKTVWQKK